MRTGDIPPPFPWFGGKSLAADEIWKRLGPVENYKEPFFGSGAVLLARPQPGGFEVINDADCFVANFWRSVQADPRAVARCAANPANEADLHARHLWLAKNRRFQERMKTDPDFHDPKVAGWWVWGVALWIGSGWCRYPGQRKRPALNGRRGVSGRSAEELAAFFGVLQTRLAKAAVCCGSWERIMGDGAGTGGGITGILLDPPYGSDRDGRCYRIDSEGVAAAAAQWARDNGHRKNLRIALCGHEGEHDLPGWKCVAWRGNGGNGNAAQGRGRSNTGLERIWFSPYCLEPQMELL